MAEPYEPEAAQSVRPHLVPDEELAVALRATDAIVAVTDRRLLVKVNQRIALTVPFAGLRRIQLDVERQRMATLVILPEDPTLEPQVLSIPGSEMEHVARVVASVGSQFAAEAVGRSPAGAPAAS